MSRAEIQNPSIWPCQFSTNAETPSTLPRKSTIGPPLLPGMVVAVICTSETIEVNRCQKAPSMEWENSSERFDISAPVRTALTEPSVTVNDRPAGEPKAITGSPFLGGSVDIGKGTSERVVSIWITARSRSGATRRTPTMGASPRSWKMTRPLCAHQYNGSK